MAGITIELSEYVIDAIADAVVKKMQKTTAETLDKIRAEIATLDNINASYDFEGYCKAVTDVLEIIDKYGVEVDKKYEHSCCYWENNKCILGKDYCPDNNRCDSFD